MYKCTMLQFITIRKFVSIIGTYILYNADLYKILIMQ